MKASPFAKLSADIVRSSIWLTAPHVRLTWVTMLALSDAEGWVGGSVAGLAHAANLPVEQIRDALAILAAPDHDSRNPANEGRRIEAVERGWRILNYTEFRSSDSRRDYMRAYMRRRRAEAAADGTKPDSESDSEETQKETEAEVKDNRKPVRFTGQPAAGPPEPSEPTASVVLLPGFTPEAPKLPATPRKAGRGSLPRGVTAESALALAGAAVDELHRLTGSAYRADGADTLRRAGVLVAMGYTPGQAAAVVRAKHAEWKGDPEMAKFLRPSTLLGQEKFPGYVEQAESTTGRKLAALPKFGYGEPEGGE